jgi:hypothetical protein
MCAIGCCRWPLLVHWRLNMVLKWCYDCASVVLAWCWSDVRVDNSVVIE